MSVDDLFSVRDQVVMITGAGRGIGRALALAFAEAGARLVLASRTVAQNEAVAAEAQRRGAKALAIPVDLRSRSSIEQLVDNATHEFGRIDVLINNAGVFINRPALEMTEDEWDTMMDTNLKGLFFCTTTVAQGMATRKSGCIINLSSALAVVAQVGYACYGVTKAGVEQLTRVLALEWAPYNIRVNAIAPTTTVTPERTEQFQTPAALARAQEKIPLGGRFGRSEDLIGAALYLASPASSFMTGRTLTIDGGFSLP